MMRAQKFCNDWVRLTVNYYYLLNVLALIKCCVLRLSLVSLAQTSSSFIHSVSSSAFTFSLDSEISSFAVTNSSHRYLSFSEVVCSHIHTVLAVVVAKHKYKSLSLMKTSRSSYFSNHKIQLLSVAHVTATDVSHFDGIAFERRSSSSFISKWEMIWKSLFFVCVFNDDEVEQFSRNCVNYLWKRVATQTLMKMEEHEEKEEGKLFVFSVSLIQMSPTLCWSDASDCFKTREWDSLHCDHSIA